MVICELFGASELRSEVLSLKNIQIYLVFCTLIRTSDH